MISLKGREARSRFLAEAERLEAFASDLRLVAHLGELPPERLSGAPLLENWRFFPVPAICLEGKVTGHPELTDNHVIRTSDVWLIAEDEHWARTVSRFYRLGRPAKASSDD